MNKKEAENFVYKSYLKAQQFQDYHLKDSKKRRNDLTYELIRKKSITPCVVVTGSKGKGSVASIISQILQTECNVGLMTSPHIVDFCERFRVNGGQIEENEFIKQIALLQEEIEAIDKEIPQNVCVSPMGIQTYLALNYFQEKETEFNIFECGKGAKHDDVNNIKHDYAIINSIFLEHTRELGETIEEIAEDKAHVITGEQKCVYIGEQVDSVLNVIKKRASRFKVPIKIYGKDFWAENISYTKNGMVFDLILDQECYSNIKIPLLGDHQAKNCALALAICIDIIKELSHGQRNQKINFKKIKESLLKIHWPGRMEIISKNPFTMLDACINAVSCKNVLKTLHYLNISDVILILGIPDDKDYLGVAKAMKNIVSFVILTKSQNPHYVFTSRQQERLKEEGIEACPTDSILEAINLAKEKSNRNMQNKEKKKVLYPEFQEEDKAIIILGTTSVIAEVKGECYEYL